MKKFDTTTAFITNHVRSSGYPVGEVIDTLGFSSLGGVGGSKWKATGNTIAVSQTPLLLDDIKLSDASGNEFQLMLEESGIIDLNVLGGTSAAFINIATAAGLIFSQGLSPVVAQNDVVNIDTLSTLVNRAGVSAGEAFDLKARSTGKGGSGIWDSVTKGTTPGVDLPDTFSIVVGVADPLIAFVLRIDRIITPEHLGVFAEGTSGADVIVGLQAYADYCIANDLQFTWGSSNGYRITTNLVIPDRLNFTAISKEKGVLVCDNCSGIDFTGATTTPSNVTVEKTRIGQVIRHTTTPNTFFGVKFTGSTGSRPFWNTLQDMFIDGFGIPLELEWFWDGTITGVNTVFCGKFINGTGKSVNNTIYNCKVGGNLTAIDIGDGTNTMEGWQIHHMLFDGLNVGSALDASGVAFSSFHHNICDFMGAVTAILVRSTGSLAPTGWDMHHLYVAFSAAGVTGIRLLNNVVPGATNKGHTIDRSRIFFYPTFSLINGIVTDGTEEENNIITNNKIDATTNACNIAGAKNTNVIGNKWLGGGFSTTVECIYDNNEGTITTGETLMTRIFGARKESLGSAAPVTGTHNRGDVVWFLAPSAAGKIGSVCVLSGTPGTWKDWGAIDA